MNVFSHPDFADHEQVVYCSDVGSGLRAIIAIHNTALGPALGGCRINDYASEELALKDVLRLSHGMTYKAALAGLPLGGGKAVIMADPTKDKTPAMMRAMGRAVDALGGRYITAQDSGTTVEDVETMSQETEFTAGAEKLPSGIETAPSPSTALGVFSGMQAAIAVTLGKNSFRGLKVGVLGLGNVGYALAERLHDAGAELLVSDINEQRMQLAVANFGATAMPSAELLRADMDVFSPCALGGALDREVVNHLQCTIVAGAANNQLKTAEQGEQLAQRGVTYVPDYLLNAGGIIHLHHVRCGTIAASDAQVEEIGTTVTQLLQRARRENKLPELIADRMAEERFQGKTANPSRVA